MKTTEIFERLTHLDFLSINRGGKVVTVDVHEALSSNPNCS